LPRLACQRRKTLQKRLGIIRRDTGQSLLAMLHGFRHLDARFGEHLGLTHELVGASRTRELTNEQFMCGGKAVQIL
jgi:hypothetical protein